MFICNQSIDQSTKQSINPGILSLSHEDAPSNKEELCFKHPLSSGADNTKPCVVWAQHNDHSLLITSYLDTLLPGSSPPTWITEENEEVERRFIGRSHFVVDERGGDALNSSDVFTHTSCRVYHKTESSVGSLGDAQHAESGEET